MLLPSVVAFKQLEDVTCNRHRNAWFHNNRLRCASPSSQSLCSTLCVSKTVLLCTSLVFWIYPFFQRARHIWIDQAIGEEVNNYLICREKNLPYHVTAPAVSPAQPTSSPEPNNDQNNNPPTVHDIDKYYTYKKRRWFEWECTYICSTIFLVWSIEHPNKY